jgi:hypothetical protein
MQLSTISSYCTDICLARLRKVTTAGNPTYHQKASWTRSRSTANRKRKHRLDDLGGRWEDTVTCLGKAGITEPEKAAVARQCKYISTATKTRFRGNIYARNNRGTVGGVVLCWVRAESTPI